jgi:hypothetical protein
VVIRTIASVASWIEGLGLASHDRRPGPWKTRAFMVGGCSTGFTASDGTLSVLIEFLQALMFAYREPLRRVVVSLTL